MANWIKCSDRMPPDWLEVLVYKSNLEYTIACFVGTNIVPCNVLGGDSKSSIDFTPTHWAVKPDGPQN